MFRVGFSSCEISGICWFWCLFCFLLWWVGFLIWCLGLAVWGWLVGFAFVRILFVCCEVGLDLLEISWWVSLF